MFKPGVLLATVVAAVAAMVPAPAEAHADCQLPVFGPGSRYHPKFKPSRHTADVTNPWFPLKPRRTLVSVGMKDGKKALDVVDITPRTRVVAGVRTRVVEDRLYLDRVLAERTSDYYAQDRCGNVWYFGEDTAELDSHGRVVSTEGSFHAGVDGAQAGVLMQARPQLGRKFRQEWYAGEAEDVFWAVERHATITVPFRTFRNALRTVETTALEPGVVDNKYYVRGIGPVAELSVRGPVERLALVKVIP
ncbi:hypothetical protein OG809_28960 [Kribbella soli]